jgi:adenine-specific DNA-methyltransferase
MTPAERILWHRLRNRQVFGHKFRRQHPVGPYIVDFCCPVLKLVIEIDGDSHADSVQRDAERTAFLQENGCRVIRFTNVDVHRNLRAVLDAILEACDRHSAERPHSGRRGER